MQERHRARTQAHCREVRHLQLVQQLEHRLGRLPMGERVGGGGGGPMARQLYHKQAIVRGELVEKGMPVRPPAPEAMQEHQGLPGAVVLIVQR